MASKHEVRDFRNELDLLSNVNLYRQLKTVENLGPLARVNGKTVMHLCSNDYLGLSRNQKVIMAMKEALKNGVSQCSSRLVSGTSKELEELENALAKQKRRESALVYPTGYMTNIGVISAITTKNDLIVSDELNHASIVDACRLSRATVSVYKHNDVEDLMLKLSSRGFRRKLVVTEGVFSMDGDLAALKQIGKISKENDALLVVDDAHGDFVCGKNFRGTSEYLSAEKYIDAIVSSMSKALGCFGGYVVGTNDFVKYLVNKSRSFIYTSALPSVLASAAIEAMKIVQKGEVQRQLWNNVNKFRRELTEMGFEITSSTHIIPIIIGEEKMSADFSKLLMKNGVFAQAIRYPTVRRGSARIRISMTSLLGDYLDEALRAFKRAKETLLH